MRFVVFGAGAIGGVVAGRLAEAGHNVAAIARGAHRQAIVAHGLSVESPAGKAVIQLPVYATAEEATMSSEDVVLLCVKSQDTVEALDQIAAAAGSEVPIVCLQNGVHNEREALRRFSNVYGGVVMCPTVYLHPGSVRAYSSPTTGIIDIGRFPAGVDDVAEAIAAALTAATFSSVARSDISRWKWAKLATNLGNAIEAVCGPPARRGPLGDIVTAEAYSVLDAAGIDYATSVEDAERRGTHLQVQPIEGEKRPGGSSWQSLARGVSTIETDYLNGEIVMLGRIHGVPTPANEVLQRLANELITAGAGPGSVDADELIASLPTRPG